MTSMLFSPRFLLLVTLLTAWAQTARAQKFTLAVFPDTQTAVNYRPAMLTSQVRWIVGNAPKRNIKFVLHVGDLVDWHDDYQWKVADEGMAVLDRAGIPYAIAVGNHDTAAVDVGGSAAPGNVRANLRDTTHFNHHFPPQRFRAQQGRMDEGRSDNSWHTFEAGGLDWLVLVLELWPRQHAIDWAQGVVTAHPNHNVIVLTHMHVDGRGNLPANHGGYGDTGPQHLFDTLLSQHPNILLVLSGHVGTTAWRDDAGVHGNRVYQLLQNYQGQDRGGGFLRLLEIDPAQGRIDAYMYSPYYDTRKDDHSRFSFESVKFIRRAAAE